ncbi:MAG: hypothetical protein CML05_09180 [Pseudozobellia sp.]|nr:hypothetical protein [Pseudozobellia sp.]
MKFKHLLSLTMFFIVVLLYGQEYNFETSIDTTGNVPWTKKAFYNDPMNFQFALISDRTGAHREGIFGKGISKLNMIMPEFVISVGDMIEGGTSDLEQIDQEWTEFDSILSPLEMRYFYVPGNHDISNSTMGKVWKQKYGYDYYHFRYKDVLFITLNTMDDFVEIGEEQVQYFEKILKEHNDVRWTFVIMHHPLWHYKELNRFDRIEELLKDRKYTVFAGHRHRYLQEFRNERNYMVLGTTGGGSKLRGPKMGEFDHVTWVTMDNQGPKIANLTLDGILETDIASKSNQDKISALSRALSLKPFYVLKNETGVKGSVWFTLKNSSNDTIFFNGRVWHHHELNFDQSKINTTVAPSESKTIELTWSLDKNTLSRDMISEIELDYTMGYASLKNELAFEIKGRQSIAMDTIYPTVSFSEPLQFIDSISVTLGETDEELPIYYTADGSVPDEGSSKYKSPIKIQNPTEIKARIIDNNGYKSPVIGQSYDKVVPSKEIKLKSRKRKGLSYTMVAGHFKSLTEIPDNKEVLKSGIAHDFKINDLIIPGKDDDFGVVYTGFVKLAKTGMYLFKSTSDDNSRIYIDERLVVDNDKRHSNRTAEGYIALEKGLHKIRIEFVERSGEQYLNPSYTILGDSKGFQTLETLEFYHVP